MQKRVVGCPSPQKRPRIETHKEMPPTAQQHAFLDAGKNRDWGAVKTFLAGCPELINVQPLGRWSMLHQASEAGSTDMVGLLLERRADIGLRTKDGRTPLEVASHKVLPLLRRAKESVDALVSRADRVSSQMGGTSIGDSVMHDDGDGASSSKCSTTKVGDAVAPTEGENAAMCVWQVQPEALGGKWIDMGDELQALLNDAKSAGVTTAMFREGGHSYIVDLMRCTQSQIGTGSISPIRMQMLSAETSTASEKAQSEATAAAAPGQRGPNRTFLDDLKSRARGLAAGQSAVAPGSGAKPCTAKSAASASDIAKEIPALLLANKWEDRVDPTGWWISEKVDGMRAFWDPVKRCLFSRLGNAILCPKALLAGLPDEALDGELFLGRGRFQELMSVVKNGANVGRIEGPWKEVVYIVFDMPKHGGKFEERMETLQELLAAKPVAGALPFARFHQQQLCKDRAHLDEELKIVQTKGGEGLMLRRAGSLYEAGRSSSLLKVKTFQDEEAVVLGYEPGKGRNSAVVGALRCRNRAGIHFSVGTGLNDAQRANPPKVGEIITYRFFELTKDDKPRFPSYVGVRADADRTGLEL